MATRLKKQSYSDEAKLRIERAKRERHENAVAARETYLALSNDEQVIARYEAHAEARSHDADRYSVLAIEVQRIERMIWDGIVQTPMQKIHRNIMHERLRNLRYAESALVQLADRSTRELADMRNYGGTYSRPFGDMIVNLAAEYADASKQALGLLTAIRQMENTLHTIASEATL